jgi:hypothetical protein
MSQAAFFWLFLAASNPGTISSEEPISLYDLRWTLDLDRKDPAALRKIWDITHLAAALQGLANRSGPRLYFRYLDVDDSG